GPDRAEPAEPLTDGRAGGEAAEAAEVAEEPDRAEELDRWRMPRPRPRPDSGSGIAAVRVPVGEGPWRERWSVSSADPGSASASAEPAGPEEPGRVRFSPVQSWSSTRLTGIAPVVKRGSTPRWMASRIRATAEADRGRLAGALASAIIT